MEAEPDVLAELTTAAGTQLQFIETDDGGIEFLALGQGEDAEYDAAKSSAKDEVALFEALTGKAAPQELVQAVEARDLELAALAEVEPAGDPSDLAREETSVEETLPPFGQQLGGVRKAAIQVGTTTTPHPYSCAYVWPASAGKEGCVPKLTGSTSTASWTQSRGEWLFCRVDVARGTARARFWWRNGDSNGSYQVEPWTYMGARQWYERNGRDHRFPHYRRCEAEGRTSNAVWAFRAGSKQDLFQLTGWHEYWEPTTLPVRFQAFY